MTVKCTPAVVQEPTILSKFTSCTVASGDSILLSPEASELDFEVELVIVIGKHAKRVPKETAMQDSLSLMT